MDILFLQEAPCIRNWKMALALGGRGHRVCLGYKWARISQMYPGLSDDAYDENVRIQGKDPLRRLVGGFDIVHCHNEPDTMTVEALRAMGPPVVHDCHDLMSLRGPADIRMERAAHSGAAGRIYTSEAQLEACRGMYGIDTDHSMVFHNICSQAMLPSQFLPKLSLVGGETHVAYEGSLSDGSLPHRDYRELFGALAEAGIHVHIHPNVQHPAYLALSRQHQRIHVHAPISPLDLVTVMTQYDWGIAPLGVTQVNRRHLESVLPNKPFEYAAAELPLILQDLPMMRRYWDGRNAGFFFDTAQDVIEGIEGWPRLPLKGEVRLFEDEVEHIEAFYRKLLQVPAREHHFRAQEVLGEVFGEGEGGGVR